jgi:hypothetical protein
LVICDVVDVVEERLKMERDRREMTSF